MFIFITFPNSRFDSVQSHAFEHFLNYDLDALFIATHAPGQSAYNIVERRMAPLSHDLAGLILPHDHYGSHLNKSLKCVDSELEKLNFEKAGTVLAEVWSQTVIDNELVVAKYIDPGELHPTAGYQTEEWKSMHVRSSQYLLQVVKCNDESCCKPFRSNINAILRNRFLPAPVMYTKKESGVFAATEDELESAHFGSLSERILLDHIRPKDFKILPYDFYCPSVRPKILTRVCKKCGLYFCTVTALKLHKLAVSA